MLPEVMRALVVEAVEAEAEVEVEAVDRQEEVEGFFRPSLPAYHPLRRPRV